MKQLLKSRLLRVWQGPPPVEHPFTRDELLHTLFAIWYRVENLGKADPGQTAALKSMQEKLKACLAEMSGAPSSQDAADEIISAQGIDFLVNKHQTGA